MISIAEVPLGFASIGSGALQSATPLSSIAGGIPAGANSVLLQADTAAVRFRDDGVPPTASIGMALPNGLAPFEYSGDLAALQVIAMSGSPVLNCLFYRRAG